MAVAKSDRTEPSFEKDGFTVKIEFTSVIAEFEISPYANGNDALVEAMAEIGKYGKDGVYTFPKVPVARNLSPVFTTVTVENA